MEMTTIKDEETARKRLSDWIRQQGFKPEVRFASCRLRGKWWDLEAYEPYGLFFVHADSGEVQDNYRYFTAERAKDHPETCGCSFCCP